MDSPFLSFSSNAAFSSFPPPDTRFMRQLILDMHKQSPFLTITELGKSVLGRSIYALQLGESRERVLYVGGFRGQEWISSLLLLKFIYSLCGALDTGERTADIDVRRALLGRGLVFVPCINPDGIEIALHGAEGANELCESVTAACHGRFDKWQANACGVDLTHNFDAGWHLLRQLENTLGINGPSPEQYGGQMPESEPETKVLANLCRTIRFRHALAFHHSGEEILWQYGKHTPERSQLMTKILSVTSGYDAVTGEDPFEHASFKDWFVKEFCRPAFSISLCKNINASAMSLADVFPLYQRLEEMLILSAIM